MKNCLKRLWVPLVLAVSVSCSWEMDPYEGGDGVRMNLNGEKCVMVGTPNSAYARYVSGEEYRFETAEIFMLQLLDNRSFTLVLKVTDTAPIVTAKTYPKGTAVLIYDDSHEQISLSGEVVFLETGEETEACFDLSGTGADGTRYEMRHGFLRLLTQTVEEAQQ